MAELDGSVRIGVDFDVDAKPLKNINKSIDDNLNQIKSNFSNVSGLAGSVLKGVGSAAKTVVDMSVKGIAAASGAIGAVMAFGQSYNSEIEQYKTSFEVMTGSAEKAAEVTERLVKLGAATPFETKDLAKSTQLLMNYGLSADDAVESLMMLGDISQGDANKLDSISLAYGQMTSAGKVYLQDVKQMINAGFNPLQEITESTGESMDSLYDRISKGTLSVDEITASMKRSTSQGGKYFQSMEKQSKTASGQISTLKDNLSQLAGAIAGSTSTSLTESVLPMINEMVGELQSAFELDGFDGMAVKFGDYLADILAMGANKLPDIMNMGSKIVSALAEGLVENADSISDSFLTVLLALPDFIIDNLGTLIQVGSIFIQRFTEGIINNSDKLSKSAVEIVMMLIDFIIDNAPLIAKAAKELVKSLAKAIGDAVPQLKPFTDIIEKLADNIVPIAEAIAPLAAAILTLKTVKPVVGIIEGLAAAFTAAGGAAGVFSGVVAALGGPVTIGIGALAGITTAVALLNSEFETTDTRFNEFMDGQEKLRSEAEKTRDKFIESKEAAEDSAEADDIKYQKVQDLWKELQTLADEQGNVNEKNQEHAQYIIDTLNDTLDTEIEMVDGQIQKYDELKQSIDDVIASKRAEALLSNYNEAYSTALTSQADYRKALETAITQRNNAADTLDLFKYSLFKAGYNGSVDSNSLIKWRNQFQEFGGQGGYLYETGLSMGEVNEAINAAKQLEEIGVTISDIQSKYNEVTETIDKLDDAQEEFANGNYQAVQDILLDTKRANADILADTKRSYAEREQEYRDMQAQTLADLEISLAAQSDKEVKAAIDRYNELTDEAKKGGLACADSFSKEYLSIINDALINGYDIDDILIFYANLGLDIGDTLGANAQARFNELMSTTVNAWDIAGNDLQTMSINSPGDLSTPGYISRVKEWQAQRAANVTNNNTYYVNSPSDARILAQRLEDEKKKQDAGKGG